VKDIAGSQQPVRMTWRTVQWQMASFRMIWRTVQWQMASLLFQQSI
jgi:hypothetical protein